MRRIIIQERAQIHPFNEPARELRVQNKPLWLHQRDLLARYVSEEREYESFEQAVRGEKFEAREALALCDNLFFNAELIDEFMSRARQTGGPARLALSCDDPAVRRHIWPLTSSLATQDGLVLVDMWYLPGGLHAYREARPLVISTESREIGYYHVPTYMADFKGDLVYQLPRKALVVVESWVHLFVIDVIFGVFALGKALEERVDREWPFRLGVLARALLEQRRVLDSSALVSVGRNANIDPSAVIHGRTVIGDNVTIGPGAVIDNCIIGNNVNVAQGCQLMLSVVSDGCFLPFRASLFMSTLMENTMVAQNTCLQLCVVGRDTFIGAGTTFTDFKLLPGPLRAAASGGQLAPTDLHVLGGCVGHHCRLGSGLLIYPARTVESDVVLLAQSARHIITDNVSYEQSDHHALKLAYPYPRLYPRSP